MNDQTIEQQIKDKGLTAPRVTLDALNANIVSVEIVKHLAAGRQVLRWAVLTTRSGYAVTGRPSVSVSPENDNAELGEQIARDNARNELWALMGYALKDRLAGPTDDQVGRFLSWSLPANFSPDAGVYFKPPSHMASWPTGTNLLSAPQAKAMLQHVLGG